MEKYGMVTEPGTVRFERVLPGPIERVWAYLTESEKREKWLASGKMELKAGGRVELFFRHADLSTVIEKVPEKYKSHEKGSGFTSRIIRCEPPRLLSFTWGGEKDSSEVTFELIPKGENVLLILTHRLLDSRNAMISVASGWHTHLDVLMDNLSGNAPAGFWSQHTGYEEEYNKRLPAER